ncbi:aminopeptidase [Lentibacillus sp. N15]|uniref:aminopeptidase n=1 Tax=Lentibacillus songyuanensis TaxID=3136161 RepID=UPI0031BA2C5C
MKVNDTTKDFFRLYEADLPFDLHEYHKLYPSIFSTYFNGYCKKTSERLLVAKKRYFEDYSRLKKVNRLLPSVIDKVVTKGESFFGFSLNVPAHILVGLYASNAFVDHQTEVYFAIEKLQPDPELLEIIVAHEIIHSYHYHILDRAGINWNIIDWSDVRNSMYLEGIATYFSQKLVPGYPQSYYFSYDKNGKDWLSYCQNHQLIIAEAFLADLDNQPNEMEREWFRLSGGQRLGYNRLGYFLGTAFVHNLCNKLSDHEIFTLLAQNKASIAVNKWFQKLTSGYN